MKKLVLILSVLALYSCTEANVVKEKTGYVVKDEYAPLEIVVMDSCEYLYGDWGNAAVLTHKGNCKNHRK